MNLAGKIRYGLEFFSDAVAAPAWLAPVLLAGLLGLALRRIRPRPE